MQHQLKLMWCWSAVGTSCALFYRPDSGWTQCKMATQAIVPSPGNCCVDSEPTACDQPYTLDDADHHGSLSTAHIANGFEAGAIPFDRLKTELDAGRLVPFRLLLDFEGHRVGHFVVVAAYSENNGLQHVTVFDPYFGNAIMEYDKFVNAYKHDGKVTHTFFTVPPTPN